LAGSDVEVPVALEFENWRWRRSTGRRQSKKKHGRSLESTCFDSIPKAFQDLELWYEISALVTSDENLQEIVSIVQSEGVSLEVTLMVDTQTLAADTK